MKIMNKKCIHPFSKALVLMGVARKQFRVFGKPIKHIFKRPQPRFEPQNYEADVLTALHRYTNYVSPNLMLIFFNMQGKKIMCV